MLGAVADFEKEKGHENVRGVARDFGRPSAPSPARRSWQAPVALEGQRGRLDPDEYGAGALQLAQHQERTTRQTPPSGAPPDDFVRLGRSLFNQHCSHCHAPNAMSAEPSRDLRRLMLRYGAKMRETAYATITVGRVDKGMPGWKDLLGEEGIQNVLGFLESVQRAP